MLDALPSAATPASHAPPSSFSLHASPATGPTTSTALQCSHHICLEVDDIHASMRHVGERVRLLDKQPKIGAHGLPVVFAHPKDLCGVLTELEEVKR